MSGGPGGGLRILLVEDELANRALIRAILARAKAPALAGHVLHEAATIGAARAILAASPIDVILLDVRLPDGSGPDLAAEVRASDRPAVRIIIVSASVLPADRSQAVASGADEFLGKPFGAADLVNAIVGLVAESR
jgi:CheY-like chemotaxis protein